MFRFAAGFIGAGLFGAANTTASCDAALCENPAEVDDVVNAKFVDTHEHSNKSTPAVSYPWHKHSSGITMRYKPFECIGSVPLTDDGSVKLIRFKIPDDGAFDLPACSTLQVRLWLSASDYVERWMTPCSTLGTKGHFDIIVRHMPKGRMSGHLVQDLKVGDKVDFRSQQFKLKYRANRYDTIGLIGGGTGITPLLQVIRHALPLADSDSYTRHALGSLPKSALGNTDDAVAPEGLAALKMQQQQDHTKLSLLFCNRNENHILLKGYMDELATRFPDRFKVKYCVDKPLNPQSWTGFTGYVTPQMVAETMPKIKTPEQIKAGEKKNIVLIAGPDGLLNTLAGWRNYTLEAMHGGGATVRSKKTTGLGDLANISQIARNSPLGMHGVTIEDCYRF